MCGPIKHKVMYYNTLDPVILVSSINERNETTLLNKNKLYCLNCGQTFVSKNINYCNKCGEELGTCPISRNKFKIGDAFAQCADCLTVYHYHHLMDWLNNSDSCPNCRQNFQSILRGVIGTNSIYSI